MNEEDLDITEEDYKFYDDLIDLHLEDGVPFEINEITIIKDEDSFYIAYKDKDQLSYNSDGIRINDPTNRTVLCQMFNILLKIVTCKNEEQWYH